MDMDYLLLLQEIRNAGGDTFAAAAAFTSDLVDTFFYLTFLFLYWAWKKEYGIYGLFALTGARFINATVKLTACVYRPWILDTRIQPYPSAKVTATGYSFPSGHSATAAGGMGLLAWLNRKNKVRMCLCFLPVLCVIFLRNLLGVHTPQDVVCGCFTGFTAAFLVVVLAKWEAEGKNRDLIIFCSFAVLTVLILTYFSCKSYPMDYDESGKLLVDPMKMQWSGWKDVGSLLGVITGWLIEKRFVKFTMPDSWKVRLARFIPGLLLYAFTKGKFLRIKMLQNFFFSVFGGREGIFVFEIAAFILLMAVYPLIFMWIEKKLCRKD